MINDMKEKVKIDYPCRWVYKIIGTSQEELQALVAALLQDSPYRISLCNSSATGKYYCMNVELTVENEEKRVALYESLKQHPAVKIIL
jgi:putative lipoic acid-binding regulatory protein